MWIPSHCGIDGNEKADELAKQGSELEQSEIPVTHAIVKAKIKSRKWTIEHQRAKDTYGDRRKPDFKTERKWPQHVRRLYSRLRTGHTPELKSYRHRIGTEESPLCDKCGEEDETIQHVLCSCPWDEVRRRNMFGHTVEVRHLTTESEKCRRFLQKRYPLLSLHEGDEGENSEVDDSEEQQ